jgi:thiol-disulfide isomerase/thioredoxin
MDNRLVPLAAALAATALGGCGAATVGPPPTAAQARRALAGSPPALAAVHRQAGLLLGGGPSALKGRIATLRGYPVVVNKWASWCYPCRAEFALFQRVSVDYGRRVAFLGLDGGDSTAGARRFLARHPVSYPSYVDPHEAAARALEAPSGYPITLFFDRRGRPAFIHQGSYASERLLVRDLRRYALAAS